jgi:cbb3-type cytochrome oxidase subunit 1
VGLLIGILISLELVYSKFDLTSWRTDGRLKPIRANVIYGYR